jgi:glucosamine kinase
MAWMTGLAGVRYLIGVDGGGTVTRARLTRTDGEILGFAESGPSALGQGVDQAWRNVSAAIERAFHSAALENWRPDECAVGLGLSGAIVASQNREFIAAARRFVHLALANDAFTALLGAHAGKPGAIVIAGTGSIGEALLRDGTHLCIGGWGHPIGDEGSGAWLGMQAIRRTQAFVDRRVSDGALVSAVQAVAGATREALLAWCEHAGQYEYASLARLVFESEGADPWAAELLVVAARAIDDLALSLDRGGALPLVVAGGIGERLKPRLGSAVRDRLVEPAGDAVDGALHLIRDRLRRTRVDSDGL